MSIADIQNEHQRISILHALFSQNDYRANDSIIQMVCDRFGNNMSTDTVKVQLAWLEEQSLVVTEKVGEYTVAQITKRGLEVQQGRASVPGVKRPLPSL